MSVDTAISTDRLGAFGHLFYYKYQCSINRITMTYQSPRIYTYKITFEEVPYYYYGVHKERKHNEHYMGSPYTHKWCWDFYTPKKHILELFEYNDEGWLEAQKVEDRLIGPVYQTDKWCLNESCGAKISLKSKRKSGKKCYTEKKGCFSLSPEEKSELGRRNGKKGYENKTGIHGLSNEDRLRFGKIAGQMTYNKKKGIHSPDNINSKSIGGKISGKKCYEEKKGCFSLSPEEKSELGRRNGKKGYENKTGIHSQTIDDKRELGRKTSSQVWECMITGHRSTPGGLYNYQKARGIDPSNRKRII